MVWQEHSAIIVMITKEVERGRVRLYMSIYLITYTILSVQRQLEQ